MKDLKPWGYIHFDQFVFMNDVMGSSEWADLAQKCHVVQLQDLLDWAWSLRLTGKTANEVKAELFSHSLDLKKVEKYIDHRINHPKQFLVKVGDQVFLKNDNGVRKIEITKVVVDFGCPYGGAYPIHLDFFEIGDEGTAGEMDDIWVNAFGYSDNNLNAYIVSCQEQLSNEQIQSVRQTFIEALFMHDSWEKVIKRHPENAERSKLTNALFDKFVKLAKSKHLQDLVKTEQMIPEYINREIEALI